MSRRRLVYVVAILVLGLWMFIGQVREQLPDTTEAPELSQQEVFDLLHEAERDMEIRRRRVEQVCTKYNLGLYRTSAEKPSVKHPLIPRYGVFYIDQAHKMTFCPILKVGSSTWRHQLLRLAGYSEDFLTNKSFHLNNLPRLHYPAPDPDSAEEAFRTTLKLMTVRHPFERLISAYRDKLENITDRYYFYEKYSKKIVSKYRNITDDAIRNTQREPTFREFVTYLISEEFSEFDDHWLPFYLYCTPCLVRYDVIAHLETMLRDQLYAIYAADMQDLLQPRWRHLTKGKRSSRGAIAQRYFSELSPWHAQRLYEVYKLDFELFGYSPDEYFDYVIKEK